MSCSSITLPAGLSTVWCRECGAQFDPRKEGNWRLRLCIKCERDDGDA